MHYLNHFDGYALCTHKQHRLDTMCPSFHTPCAIFFHQEKNGFNYTQTEEDDLNDLKGNDSEDQDESGVNPGKEEALNYKKSVDNTKVEMTPPTSASRPEPNEEKPANDYHARSSVCHVFKLLPAMKHILDVLIATAMRQKRASSCSCLAFLKPRLVQKFLLCEMIQRRFMVHSCCCFEPLTLLCTTLHTVYIFHSNPVTFNTATVHNN